MTFNYVCSLPSPGPWRLRAFGGLIYAFDTATSTLHLVTAAGLVVLTVATAPSDVKEWFEDKLDGAHGR